MFLCRLSLYQLEEINPAFKDLSECRLTANSDWPANIGNQWWKWLGYEFHINSKFYENLDHLFYITRVFIIYGCIIYAPVLFSYHILEVIYFVIIQFLNQSDAQNKEGFLQVFRTIGSYLYWCHTCMAWWCWYLMLSSVSVQVSHAVILFTEETNRLVSQQ